MEIRILYAKTPDGTNIASQSLHADILPGATETIRFTHHFRDPGLHELSAKIEGPDDMPAHIKGALTQTSLTIPVTGGQMVLGTWQGIFVFEHRTRPHRRQIVLHLAGE